jgi:undecaprenyl-diphosphatase
MLMMQPGIPEKLLQRHPLIVALGISAALFLLRLIFVTFGPLDLAPDEAQYWDWSRRLEWSYATKPPLVAWLIALSSSVLGDTYLGVRFFALVGQALLPVVGFILARDVSGIKAGWWAFFLLTLAPLVAAGGLMMSPDVPSVLLWLLALWGTGRALAARGPLQSWAYWGAVGLFAGLGGLAKPTVSLFFPLVWLFLLFYRRGWVARPHFYVAGGIALVCQAPVLYWNMTHDWAMFRHILWQADSQDMRWGGLASLFNFLEGQLLVLGPLSFVALLGALLWSGWHKQDREQLLFWLFAPVFAGFLFLSLTGKVQANWPVLGTVTGLVWLATLLPGWPVVLRYGLIAGLSLNAVAVIFLYDTSLLRRVGVNLQAKHSPAKTMLGWRGLGQQLAPHLQEFPQAVVLTTRYQTTAGLAFHTPGQPWVAYINPGWRRENQYDFWPPALAGRKVLYVNEQGIVPDRVAALFQQCARRADLKAVHRGQVVRTARVYLCE